MKHFTATIEFTVFDDTTDAKALLEELGEVVGSPFNDEPIAHQLNEQIVDGHVELDAVKDLAVVE